MSKTPMTQGEIASEERREKRLRDGAPALFTAAENLLFAVDHGRSTEAALADLRAAVNKARYAETSN